MYDTKAVADKRKRVFYHPESVNMTNYRTQHDYKATVNNSCVQVQTILRIHVFQIKIFRLIMPVLASYVKLLSIILTWT